jgi:gamma-glutamyl-gamma-aminobutyrate hydrolase PuuD
MSKVRIGVTTSPLVHDDIAVEGVNRSYVDAVVRAGAIPVVFPVLDARDVDDLLRSVDGIVLSGGVDIDPSWYGAERQPEVEVVDLARDEFELALVRAAADLGVPVLGVCRGMQLINVAFGGTLIQHLPESTDDKGHRERVRFAEVIHDVDVLEGSRLAEVLGETRIGVNTLHHQAVDTIGAGLVPVAWSSHDGIIEAVEGVGTSRILGVQWHPELLPHLPGNPELFAWLVSACTTETALIDPEVSTTPTAALPLVATTAELPPATPRTRRRRSAV